MRRSTAEFTLGSCEATRRRWLDLAGYASIGAAFWVAVVSFWPKGLVELLHLPLAGVCSTIVVLLGFLVWAANGRALAFWGLKHPIRHPPLWLAGTVGAALVLTIVARAAISPDPAAHASPLLRAAGALVLASSAVLVLARTLGRAIGLLASRRRPAASVLVRPAAPGHLSDYTSIVGWISDDRPVEAPGDDRFDLAPIAKRTAERLVRRAGSQLVVGALGSGKTSLRNLTDWNLRQLAGGERIHLVRVELWQYDTARAAVAGIIRALAQELGTQTNVFSVTGVRSQYLAAMSESGSAGAALAKVIHKDDDPYEVLKDIDLVARAIDRRLVVWIEDIERFVDGGVSAGMPGVGAASVRSAELLNPVRALVHGLDRLERVSVVTATTSLLGRFDSEKLARFVEDVPRPGFDQVARLLNEFRKGLVEAHPDDLPSRLGAGLDFLEGPHRLLWGRSPQGRDATETFVLLFDTPRKLKMALRLVSDIWKKLHGELDLDDLILMTGLKVASPRGFSLIRDYHPELQRFGKEEDKGPEQNFSRALDDVLGLTPERKDVWTITQAIFSRSDASARPQGLHIDRYWTRFLAEEAPADADRDQPVLRAIRAQDTDSLIELLVTGRAPAVENFDRLLPDEVAFGLLVPLCERLVDVDPRSWATGEPFGEYAPGVVNLWRTLTEKLGHTPPDTFDGVLDRFESQLTAALARSVANLGLLRDLEDLYLPSASSHPLVRPMGGWDRSQSLARNVRESYWAALVVHYADRPAVLAAAIRPARAFALRRVLWGSERTERKAFAGIPFPSWPRLAPTLVAAARNDLDVLAELAPFVVREIGPATEDQALEFDGELCVRLFGSEEIVLRLPWETLPPKFRTGGCGEAVRRAALRVAWAQRLGEREE